MFDFSAEFFNRELAVECKKLGIEKATAYDLRHGGASDDAAAGVELLKIQKRGRWQQFISVRRYEKHGLLQESLSLLGPAKRRHCDHIAAQLTFNIQNPLAAPHPPRWG